MKKFKDGKIVEVSQEEKERMQKRFERWKEKNQTNSYRPHSLSNLEKRIKELEEIINTLQNEKKLEESIDIENA